MLRFRALLTAVTAVALLSWAAAFAVPAHGDASTATAMASAVASADSTAVRLRTTISFQSRLEP